MGLNPLGAGGANGCPVAMMCKKFFNGLDRKVNFITILTFGIKARTFYYYEKWFFSIKTV